jgi:hypothetical protein
MSSAVDFNVSSAIYNVDPSQAQVWLNNNNYENQRPIRSSHVSYLASEIEKGRFIDGTAIHFAKINGHLKLVNGQHTLAAIVRSGRSQALTVTTSQVSTPLQVAELYFRHDNHLTRQISDAFRALNLEEETGLNITQQQWVGSAIYLIMCGLGGQTSRGPKSRISRDDLAQGVVNLAEPAKNFLKCIFGARTVMNRALTRRASMAIGLITFFYSPDTAEKFWKEVAFTDNVRTGDPRKTLADLMVEIGMTGGSASNRRATSASYHCRAISVAWNAFFEDRDLKLIKVYEDSPIKILGSPYTGDKASNEIQTKNFSNSLSFR